MIDKFAPAVAKSVTRSDIRQQKNHENRNSRPRATILRRRSV
jgi:hypothetical protein